MNFFEQQLRKLTELSDVLDDPRFIGRTCYGRVSENIRAKLQLITMGMSQQYEALKITLINNTEGEIDQSVIRFSDIWGVKDIQHMPNTINPHIWTYHGKSEWFGYRPTPEDFETLAKNLDDYLEIFSENIEYGQSMT